MQTLSRHAASVGLMVLVLLIATPAFAAEPDPSNTSDAPDKEHAAVKTLLKQIVELREQNKQLKQKLEQTRRRTNDGNLLHILRGDEKDRLRIREPLKKKLAELKVPNETEATKLGLRHQLNAGGVHALESWRITSLFQCGANIEGFAKKGDLLWEFRIGFMHGLGDAAVNQIVWINSANGKTHALLPVVKKNVAPLIKPAPKSGRRKPDQPLMTDWLAYHKASKQTRPAAVAAKLAELQRATIATIDDARAVLGTFYFEATGDLTIKDRVEVTDLFQLGVDVKGFGKKGDLVWKARVIKDKDGVVLAGWISSTTGELRTISLDEPQPRNNRRGRSFQPDRLRPSHLDSRRPNI